MVAIVHDEGLCLLEFNDRRGLEKEVQGLRQVKDLVGRREAAVETPRDDQRLQDRPRQMSGSAGRR